MEYRIDNKITKEEYIYLRNKVSWKELDLNQIEAAISQNKYLVTLRNDNDILGMIRCISDSSHLFLLCDCIVNPDYQGKGLGRVLVETIINKINEDYKNQYKRIYIMSLKGKEGFYKALGFSYDEITGLAIIKWGKYERD